VKGLLELEDLGRGGDRVIAAADRSPDGQAQLSVQELVLQSGGVKPPPRRTVGRAASLSTVEWEESISKVDCHPGVSQGSSGGVEANACLRARPANRSI